MEDETEKALQRRVVRVTVELANGEVESWSIHDRDGILCLCISKEQNFVITRAYCGDPKETGIALLTVLLKAIETLEQAVRLDQWSWKKRN